MDSKRLFFLLSAGTTFMLAGFITSAYFANSQLEKYAKQVADKRAQVTMLEDEQDSLAKAKQELKTYDELSKIAASIVPQDKDQAQTVREIVNIASANGIRLGSITFPSSTLGNAKPSSGSSPKSTLSTGSKVDLSQLKRVPDIPGVYDLQIIVTSDPDAPVSYNRFINFLNDLEHNRRTALVSNITITPDKQNRSALAFTLTLDEYIKP